MKPLQLVRCAVLFGVAGSFAAGVAGVPGVPGIVDAQVAAPRKPSTARAAVPRTGDGRPDLQGVWDFGSATPLERPAQFSGKPVLTDAEAQAYLKNLPSGGCRFVKCDGSDQGKLESAYNDGWYDVGTRLAENRTSLIIDPPDGRLPPLTPDAQKKLARIRALDPARAFIDGPEHATITDRCIVGFNSGPPMNPSAYNNMVQIVQTPAHVAILNEMIHNARIVPVDGRPHLRPAIRQWVGDSRGRWQGDTLVVETRNFRPDSAAGPGGAASTDPENAYLVERFTRIDADTLHYEYTMTDPHTWTRPWTARIPMTKSPDPLFEYACHEGNYSMTYRLSASRAAEQGRSASRRD